MTPDIKAIAESVLAADTQFLAEEISATDYSILCCNNAEVLARAYLALLDKEITIRDAVEVLCKELLKDEGYYISWKANIAMAFYDECERRGITHMHDVANSAAEYFLSNLTRLEKAQAIGVGE